MKSILGQKIGMTQVFTKDGKSIPVTVIKVEKNVVTNVLTKEKHGYDATQLAISDKKKSQYKKPEIGHFKKSQTNPKKFVKEIRNMTGYDLGQKVDVSIFNSGELVDVIGTSKGKGFAGAIKRHNQTIGPKSHGGGGGSKPIRQTGSLGEIKSNKVFKGMTMPGHLGHERVTVQNLEIIDIDLKNDMLLVKGSIPGPKKSFVIVQKAVKGLKSKKPSELVDLAETIMKNKMLEHAKKVGANINTEMSVDEMQNAIETSLAVKNLQSELVELEKESIKFSQEEEKILHDLKNFEAELNKDLEDAELQKNLEDKIKHLKNNLNNLKQKNEDNKTQLSLKKELLNKSINEASKWQVAIEEIQENTGEVKGDK